MGDVVQNLGSEGSEGKTNNEQAPKTQKLQSEELPAVGILRWAGG